MNLNWHKDLSDEKRRLIFGNEDEDSLTRGYDRKRVVHAGVRGEPVKPEDTQKVWAEQASQPSNTKKSVYINIPFCQTRCAYCGFFKNLAKDELMESFTEHLVREISQSAELPFFSSGQVNAVYLGGGTPSALHASQIERILHAVNEYIPMANDCEFTFESRTYQFTKEKIEACLDSGVNRFSLGVQSFDTKVRRSIGRADDSETVIAKLEELMNYNKAAVSIDLMFGLPYQSEMDFLEDIIKADRIGVDGMALYQLNVFDDSKLNEKIKNGALPKIPSTSEQAIYYIKAYRLISGLGYTQNSMSHWTMGTRDRSLYNRMSKEGHAMHAFGAGAGGRLNGYGYFTHPALTPYINMVSKGIKPLMGLSKMPSNAGLINTITGQIDSGFLRFDSVNRAAGTDMASLFEPLIKSWEERGMVTMNGNFMKLTPEGQFWYVNMAQALADIVQMASDIEYIPQSAKIAAQN